MPKEVFLSLGLLSISAMGYIIYARFFTPLLFFIVLDHLAGLVLNAKNLENTTRSEVLWGAAAGLCMFLGFWSLMEALAISGENLPLGVTST